jgi:hypothetical protein
MRTDYPGVTQLSRNYRYQRRHHDRRVVSIAVELSPVILPTYSAIYCPAPFNIWWAHTLRLPALSRASENKHARKNTTTSAVRCITFLTTTSDPLTPNLLTPHPISRLCRLNCPLLRAYCKRSPRPPVGKHLPFESQWGDRAIKGNRTLKRSLPPIFPFSANKPFTTLLLTCLCPQKTPRAYAQCPPQVLGE